MTIEELIDYHFSNTLGLSSGAYLADALSAVVKLHISKDDDIYFKTEEKICAECTREEYTVPYPCLTVSVIKEVLTK